MGNNKIDLSEFYRHRMEPIEVDGEDLTILCKSVMKKRPAKPVAPIGNKTMLVLLSDWQAGKKEGGGSEAIAERITNFEDRLMYRLRDLNKLGRGVNTVYAIGLGDLIEQCSGHYPMQTFNTDLDRREQMRLARRLILRLVDMLVDENYRVVLGAVPGNHGENRNSYSGKAYTSWTDNDDLAIFDGVAEVITHNPERYANVEIPLGAIADDLTLTLDIAGVVCGFAHGHTFRNGGNKNYVKTNGSIGKIESWWAGQVMGSQPISAAKILYCGHLHHFVASSATGRQVFMSPASDGGSHWYTSTTGSSCPPGMLTMLVGEGCGPFGWSDLEIL
jgi:hypothetical protein